ncbi:hypothetical protein [Nitratireductor sp. XY-223]|uniref:hypothetical protein n=1 Tax=Nitratireductor sp. XY-223 TaxID=2561926 RepID=UPI0010AA0EDB|nr:hypothetical protein [Nitratireductor sp. XY-223]
MNKTFKIVAALLIAGVALFMIRQNAQEDLNRNAVEQALEAVRNARQPGGAAWSDAPQHREQIGQSPAAMRHRQSQQQP